MNDTLTEEVSRLRTLADTVVAVPGVVRLHGGPLGGVGTYLPGERIEGLRATGDDVDIHVSIDLSRSIEDVTTAIRAAARKRSWSTVTIVVEDVEAGPV